MRFLLYGAGILTAATLLLAVLLWPLVRWLRGRPLRGYWRRVLILHLILIPTHLLVTMPGVLGWFGSRMARTRSDEAGYRGPRLTLQGEWLLQSRESLAAEAAGQEPAEPWLDPMPYDAEGQPLPGDAPAPPPDRAQGGAQRGAPSRSPPGNLNPTAGRAQRPDQDSAPDREASPAAPARVLSLVAPDGVPLRAFLVPPRQRPARYSAVLVHGLFRGGLELEPVGAMLRRLGCEVLLLELRNHGGSGRAPATFGRDEAGDVVAAVEWLRARPGDHKPKVVLFGVSLGTAAVALATTRLAERGMLDAIAAVVLDAPIDSVARTAERMFAIEPRPGHRGVAFPQPFRWLILESLQWWSGVRLRDVQPGNALRALPRDLPILLIGSGEDDRVPPAAVRALYESLPTAPARKLLWIHPDATHGRTWIEDPEGYRDRLALLLELAR